MTLDEAQLEELRIRGWTTLAEYLDAATVRSIEDKVWAFLEERGLVRHNPSTWPEKVPKLQPLRRAGAFDAFLGPDLEAVADQLLGDTNWHTYGSTPQALVAMPTTAEWQLPHKVWHMDLPAQGRTDRLNAIRVFGLVSDVAPRGGGTLVVEGSHEIIRRMIEASPDSHAGSSAEARKQLGRDHDFFAQLGRPGPDRVHRLMEVGATIDGVPVRVGEIVGRAGDLVVMNPWLVHNLNMNVSDHPRLAMSHTLYANDSHYFSSPSRLR